MIDFKPDRLGLCSYLSDEQLEQVHAAGIPIEVCPTSNLATVAEAARTIVGLRHLRKLVELGAKFTICCDDTMLFSTQISMELFEFATSFKQTGHQLKNRLLDGVNATFADC